MIEVAVEADAPLAAGAFQGRDGGLDAGVVALQDGGLGRGGDGVAVGLADVEDAHLLEAEQHGLVGVVLVFAQERRQDADAALALPDLAAELLPLAVAAHEGGVGALGEDQEAVEEAVGVELVAERQRGLPACAAHEVGDAFLQPVEGGLLGGGHAASKRKGPRTPRGRRGQVLLWVVVA